MDNESSQSMEQAENLVNDFKTLYQTLNAKNIHDGLIQKVYRDDIQFKDSFHELDGIDAFTKYCDSVYENVVYSTFDFHDQIDLRRASDANLDNELRTPTIKWG